MLLFMLLFSLSTVLLTVSAQNDINTAEVNTTTRVIVTKQRDVKVRVLIPEGFLDRWQQKENFTGKDPPKFNWQIQIKLDNDKEMNNDTHKIRVIMTYGESVGSFGLPYTRTTDRWKGKVTASLPSRTINLCAVEDVTEDSELLVTLITSSSLSRNVDITTNLVVEGHGWRTDDPVGHTIEGQLSLSSPLILTSRYDPGDGINYVLLSMDSLEGSECFCGLVSIQQPQCPYFDSVSTATRFGIWQTINENTSMVIKKTEFPSGFLIVVVAAEADEFCGFVKQECSVPRVRDLKKNLRIRLEPVASDNTRLTATLVVLVIYLFIVFLCIVLSEIQFKYDYELFEGIDRSSIIPIIVLASTMVNSYGKLEVTNDDSSKTEDVKYEGNENILSTDIKQEKEDIFLADMCKKLQLPEKSKSVYKKNQLYMGNFLLISVFYSIAVMQLAFQSAAKQKRLGDNNICFFNSKCQNPLGPFLDFNHFYSNLGYAVFGLLFAGMVFMKKKKFDNLLKEAKEKKCEIKKTCARLAELDSTHGIPHQFGIYYTLGGALAMEGLMSASYHVCPTTISFQFDTTFMYLIAILIYIKLFQNRHPDVTSNSLKAYIVLGLALILEALSLYFSHPLFWVVFCILYMCLLIVMVANFYQLGTHRSDIRFMHIRVTKLLVSETVKAVQKLFGSEKIKIRPLLIFLTFTCVINIAMCIYFAINATHNKEGASNYLLMMFMANMFLYLVYYIVMKYISNEALCLQSRLYLGFAFLTGLPSMYFFMNKEKNSNVSPAESRDMNQYCSLLHFYDGHDIWHFLGGAGLFFTYMFLLTIDEDIKYKKRTHIPVF